MPKIRVTEVLDYLKEPELVSWMLRTPKARREEKEKSSKEIGTLVDYMIQLDLGRPDPLPEVPKSYKDMVDNCLMGWRQFKKDKPELIKGIVAIQSELESDDIVGHPDIIIETADSNGIIDIKTSAAMYPKYWTQAAQYLKMRGMKASKRNFIGILRLDKETGKHFYLEIDDALKIVYEWAVFDAYLTAYNHAANCREFMRAELEKEIC